MNINSELGYQLAATAGIDHQKIMMMEVERNDGDVPGEYTVIAKIQYLARPSINEAEQPTSTVLTLTVAH